MKNNSNPGCIMHAVKRVIGLAITVLAGAWLVIGFTMDDDGVSMLYALDHPEAAGKVMATLLPALFFGSIGLWLMFSQKKQQ